MFYPDLEDAPKPRIDKQANEKRYREEQYARGLEREIRKTKREIAALEGSGLTHVPDVKGQLDDAKARLEIQTNRYYDYCQAHKINADGSRMIVSRGNDISN